MPVLHTDQRPHPFVVLVFVASYVRGVQSGPHRDIEGRYGGGGEEEGGEKDAMKRSNDAASRRYEY